MASLHHIAIWTDRLEEMRDFYTAYFGGTYNDKYTNPAKGFESYFINFGNGAKLEIMSRKDISGRKTSGELIGLTHIAFLMESKDAVIEITERLRKDGYPVTGEPRTTGDGYFESVVSDPDGNSVECIYK